MANKINIFGDIKVCWNCSDPADVVENTRNYCVECWTKVKTGLNIDDLGKEVLEKDNLIIKVVKS